MRLSAIMAVAGLLLAAATAVAGPSIAGSFQEWDPADPEYDVELLPSGVYVLTKTLADTTHEYKAVDGDLWGEGFPGANQCFTLESEEDVTWYVNLGATVDTMEGDEYVFHSLNPPIVCGGFMSELGGTDWDETDTSLTVMEDPDGDDIWEWESVIPAGVYEFKIVLNNNWSQDTYPTSQNHLLSSNGFVPVLVRYYMSDNTTEVLTDVAPMLASAVVPAACPADVGIIELTFTKDMEEITAETPSNYSVTPGRTVVAAVRDDVDHSVVRIQVEPPLVWGYDYTVEAWEVTDETGIPVDPFNNDVCFYLEKMIFEVNMHIYVEEHGFPSMVTIQGNTHPLTWEACWGCEAFDNGAGDDAVAGDTTYTVSDYFSVGYDCGGIADSTTVKYKYLVDCVLWEGDYEYGHYVHLHPNGGGQTANVWWEDVAPVDFAWCDVGVRFQVDMEAAVAQMEFSPGIDTVAIYGSELPLDWTWPPSPSSVLVDDGTNGDLVPDDLVYTALVVFPSGTYQFLEYKYAVQAVAESTFAFECDGLPNRELTLDDVDGCMPTRDGPNGREGPSGREGPMEIYDVWDRCASPSEFTTCDVGVLFQVTLDPGGQGVVCDTLAVRGSEVPLDWFDPDGTDLNDDGLDGDVVAGDGIYSRLVIFPTGTYKHLEYKYVCDGVFECEGLLENRVLELDDVGGCMRGRDGPMEIHDIWDWCVPAMPEIEVSPALVNLYVAPGEIACESLLVANSGDMGLSWAVEDTCGWLTQDPTGGLVPPADSAFVDICADAAGLPPGISTCDVVIASNDPYEPQVVVPVTVQVLAAPDLQAFLWFDSETNYVEPPMLATVIVYVCFDGFEPGEGLRSAFVRFERTFSGNKLTQTNLLGGLDEGDPELGDGWGLFSGPDCAIADPEGVVVAASVRYMYLGGPGVLELLPHDARGRLAVDCDLQGHQWCVRRDPSGHAGVWMEPPPGDCAAPDIEVLPESLAFELEDGEAECDSLVITNAGEGALLWSVSDTCGWLEGSPSGGEVSPGASENVTLTIVQTGIPDEGVPTALALHGNFPNPFNPTTRIRFDLPTAMRVSLRVYSVSGRVVRGLLDDVEHEAGYHAVAWDGRDDSGGVLSSGVYLYSLETGGDTLRKRMVLIK